MNVKKFITEVVGPDFLDGDCTVGFDTDGEVILYLGVAFDGIKAAPMSTDHLDSKRSRCGGDCSGCNCTDRD